MVSSISLAGHGPKQKRPAVERASDAQRPSADDPKQVGPGPALGANLRRIRVKRGLSLERLAQRSDVSRAMLSQIELGRSVPSVTVLWKIARALSVDFSSLIHPPSQASAVVLHAAESKRLTSGDGSFVSRSLSLPNDSRTAGFYELRLAPGAEERNDPHPPGTAGNLVVAQGAVDVDVQDCTHSLGLGDAVVFDADVPHAYRNPGLNEAWLYLVIIHAAEVG